MKAELDTDINLQRSLATCTSKEFRYFLSWLDFDEIQALRTTVHEKLRKADKVQFNRGLEQLGAIEKHLTHLAVMAEKTRFEPGWRMDRVSTLL